MHELPDKLFFNRIQDLYQLLGLPLDGVDSQSNFAIHELSLDNVDLPYKSPVFRFNFFSFVFVKDATGFYMIDEQRFDVQSGTIYFTNPGHFKSFAWDCVDSIYIVALSEAFLKENVHADIFDEFPFLLAETVPPKVLSPAEFTEFNQLCQQLLNEYTKGGQYRNRVIGNLFVVILLKIKAYFWQGYNPINEGARSSHIVREFKQCLEQHFRKLKQREAPKALRVQDCASAQNLHPNYLNSVIKTKTGKSVGTWIVEKTIGEAKAMLQNSTLSVKEISYRLGFAESAHFSSYFKKHTKQSPVEYRNQHIKATDRQIES